MRPLAWHAISLGTGVWNRNCFTTWGGSVMSDLKMSIIRPNRRALVTYAFPPPPPFTRESALQKVRQAEDSWNSCDSERVALGYTWDSRWRNRSHCLNGRSEIIAFLDRMWAKEREYRAIKELWAFDDNRIAVRIACEWCDAFGNWFRSRGNESWEFDDNGLIRERHASLNDLFIDESERKYRWPLGRRPDGHPGLSDLGI
jgi:nuclear transport factor 2 (NTF2) superfamily protein